eukprot:242699-Rhodomonas_salina.1
MSCAHPRWLCLESARAGLCADLPQTADRRCPDRVPNVKQRTAYAKHVECVRACACVCVRVRACACVCVRVRGACACVCFRQHASITRKPECKATHRQHRSRTNCL